MAYQSWVKVTSSNLNAVIYDPEEQRMQVQFRSGSIYEYVDVPEDTYLGLINASSKGKYFHRYVRNEFAFEQIK